MWWYISSVVLVILSGLIQHSPLLYIAGVKPNLTLAALVVFLGIYTRLPERTILIIAAVLSLKFYPGLDIGTLLFAGAAVFAVFAIDLLPWKRFLRTIAAASTGTLIMQVTTWDLDVFTKELFMNMLLTGTFFFLFTGYATKNKERKKHSFR